jgi:hypothetical protein
LEKLTQAFEQKDVHYALIGGFALGLWGVPRSTVVIDLLIDRSDLDKLDSIMAALLYKCRHRTDNVSQFVASTRRLGEVDCLHAFRKVSKEIIERAELKGILGESIKIRVARPEDLTGLKLQAISNDPSRMAIDRDDIEKLLQANRAHIDWELVKHYFSLFEMNELYTQICRELEKGSYQNKRFMNSGAWLDPRNCVEICKTSSRKDGKLI